MCVLNVKGKWFRHIPMLRVLHFGPHLRVYVRYEGPMPARPVPIDMPLQVFLREVATLGSLKRSHAMTKDGEVQDLHA